MNRKKIKGITKDTLDFILKVSKSSYPEEFVGLLSADEDVITEVFLLPGTLSSGESATLRLDMMPMLLSCVGSVHSHTNPGREEPSEQDLHVFSKTGGCHIITFYPYEENNWKCYDSKGEEKKIEVMKMELL